jgi:muramidase (phage lysozyme)
MFTMRFKPARILRLIKRYTKKYKVPAAVLLIVVVTIVSQVMPVRIPQTAYTPLLNVIASGESHGNYNAYFGHVGNDSIKFTDMTVGEVLQWQQTYIDQGAASSAVGKYQFLRSTLLSAAAKLHVSHEAKFDARLQDRLAIVLIEKRGSLDYAGGKITRDQFASNLSKEWASLPNVLGVNPTASYYTGDGLNAAHVSITQVYQAIDLLKS